MGVRVGVSARPLTALGFQFVAPLRANRLGVAVYVDEGKVRSSGVKSFLLRKQRQSL